VLPRLHLITDDQVLARGDVVTVASRMLEAGGAGVALHVRGPLTPAARLHEIALVPCAQSCGASLLVNDRVDVVLTTGAHGVHLGRLSLPVVEARRILGAEAWVGVSTHRPEEAAQAAREGADFAFVGTVYQTPTHPGLPGRGPEAVWEAVAAAPSLPILAIGGVTLDRVGAMLDAGAYGVAVIRGVWLERDPGEAVKRYLEVLHKGVNGATGERADE
jgi:thiamine-phosphate pyrophosphorylase